jgi:hypothetical protein
MEMLYQEVTARSQACQPRAENTSSSRLRGEARDGEAGRPGPEVVLSWPLHAEGTPYDSREGEVELKRRGTGRRDTAVAKVKGDELSSP